MFIAEDVKSLSGFKSSFVKQKSEWSEEKSLLQAKLFGFFFKLMHVFVVNTVIILTLFRSTACLQAYIFIDTSDQLNVSRGSRMS